MENMILSFKHKFIFLKTNKTAGTSMEIALSGICDPEDIITRISDDDQLAREALGFPGPQNHIIRDIRNKRGKVPNEHKFFNHMTMKDVLDRLPDLDLSGFFVFAVERDPVDRMMSLYHFRGGDSRWENFDDFLAKRSKNIWITSWDLYHVNGVNVADQIYFYEDLTGACEDLSRRFGVEVKLPAYRAKGQYRKSREIPPLSDFAKEWIRTTFTREYEAYHYTAPI